MNKETQENSLKMVNTQIMKDDVPGYTLVRIDKGKGDSITTSTKKAEKPVERVQIVGRRTRQSVEEPQELHITGVEGDDVPGIQNPSYH